MIKKTTITDIAGTAPYIVRWSIGLRFGWSLKLHKIVRPDDDRCAHDHPWRMLRIILAGGYTESHGPNHAIAQRKPWRPWAPWRIYYCPADFRHRILTLHTGVSWSLVLCGPRERDWGFYIRDGWIDWQTFVRQARTTRVKWCEESEHPERI